MTAEPQTDRHLHVVSATTPLIAGVIADYGARLRQADAREAAALINLGRAEDWNRWLEDQAKVYERRIGGLVAQCDHLAERRRLAERDRWLAILVCVAICLAVIVVSR